MKILSTIACASVLALAAGCTMFTAWKAIPPPGGCNQCHSLPIKNDWRVSYQAPALNDEKDRKYFQSEKYTMPNVDKPASALEIRKTTDEKCFECHNAPTPAHKGRTGRYHH